MNLDLLTQMETEIEELTTPKVKASKTKKTKVFTVSRDQDQVGHNHYSMVVFRRNGFVNRTDTTPDSPEVIVANLAIETAVDYVNEGTWKVGKPDSPETKAEIERCKSTTVKDTVYAELLTETLAKRVTLNIDEHLTDAKGLTVRSRWIATRLAKRKLFPTFTLDDGTEIAVTIIAVDGVPTETTETQPTEEATVLETQPTD